MFLWKNNILVTVGNELPMWRLLASIIDHKNHRYPQIQCWNLTSCNNFTFETMCEVWFGGVQR